METTVPDKAWLTGFRERMRHYGSRRPPSANGSPVSIKVRVVSGCFHREHSPRAYQLIDEALAAVSREHEPFELVEHESGPEVIAYVALGTAAAGLATSVVNLVAAILKARSDGVKAGDKPGEAVEVIVRTTIVGDEYAEENVLTVKANGAVTTAQLQKALESGLKKLAPAPGLKRSTHRRT